jgi:hypothetical protein
MISFTYKVDVSGSLDVALQLHVDKKPNYIMLCPLEEDTKGKLENNCLASVFVNSFMEISWLTKINCIV